MYSRKSELTGSKPHTFMNFWVQAFIHSSVHYQIFLLFDSVIVMFKGRGDRVACLCHCFHMDIFDHTQIRKFIGSDIEWRIGLSV
jgi:predicted GNAT superfamily acetyltransferase